MPRPKRFQFSCATLQPCPPRPQRLFGVGLRPLQRALLAAFFLPALLQTRSARADEPPYPRLANMYLHGAADASKIPQLARWDVLILDPTWPQSELRQIRLLNPSIKIFLYTCPYCMETPPPSNASWRQQNYDYAQANDLWWRNWNQTIASDWPGTQLVNITAQAPAGPQGTWRNFFASQVQQLLHDLPAADGMFYDNFWKSIAWEQGGIIQVDSDCNPTHTPAGCNGIMDSDAKVDTLWNHALRALATDTRTRLDALQTSRGGPPLAIISNSSSDYFAWLNGTLHEYFPSGSTGADPGNAYGYNWNQEMFGLPGGYLVAPFRTTPYTASVLNADWTGTLEAPDRSADFERHKRFTLASALLGDGYYSLDAATVGHGNLWWEPEYDNGGRGKGYLGYPLGPMARIGVPSGVEQVENGSFASGTSPWQSLAAQATGSWRVDAATYHTAPGAARIDVTSLQSGGSFKLYQSVPVQSGHGYSLSFWARASVTQDLELHLYSTGCPGFRCLTDQHVTLGTAWARYEIPFVSSGSALAGLNFFVRQAGTVWLDDISLREGDTSVYRRDFEHGIVVLNYTTSARAVSLGGQFWHLNVPGWALYDGAVTSSETLQPSDARILLRAQPTDVAVVPPAAAATLAQNEPNPFNPSTRLRFRLAQSGVVDLGIYNLAGRRVRTLVRGEQPGGIELQVLWDGRDDAGRRLPSGLYLCRLTAAGYTQTRKMTLVE